MSLQTRMANLITAIGTDYKQLRTWITGSSSGSLTSLTTTDKSSVVNAINEVAASAAAATIPDASTTIKGKVQLATDAQALALSSALVTLTPSNIGAIVNVNNGLAKLDGTGKVAAAQLPAYVDDVLEYATQSAFPATGATGIIYVVTSGTDLNKTYRWSGSVYVEISPSPGTTDAVIEGSTNLYFTNTRADGRADSRINTLIGDPDTDLAALYTAAKV